MEQAQTEAAPEAAVVAPAEAPKPDAPAVEAPVEKSYSQAELDRIIAKVKKNTRYNTRREIEAYYQGRGEAVPKGAVSIPEPKPEDKPPSREQFDSYEAFIEAKASFEGRKAAAKERERFESESRAKREQEEEGKLFQGFNAKVREKFPDLEERAAEVAHIQMPPGMGRAIAESDIGPEILNHLIENSKELERIAALSPSAAIREIGKLEARLEVKKDAPAPTGTIAPAPKAPAPIAPGGKPAAPPDNKPSDNDSVEEWMRKERARMKQKRGA